MYREVCFPPGCSEILGRPLTLMSEASQSLARRPLAGMTAADVFSLVMASDQDPLLRLELPAALQAAIQRDAAPLRRLVRYAESGTSRINEVRYYATACIEGNQPWDPASDPAGREALLERHLTDAAGDYGPFLVDAVAERLAAADCLGWPATPRPPLPPNVERGPDVPVLVLAGREDLRTPLENQRRAAAQFERSDVIAVPNVGHSVLASDTSDCALSALRTFLAERQLSGFCGRTARELELALPFFRSLGRVPRAEGRLPERVERTATAVDLTLRDAARWVQVGAAVPGLRGGRVVAGRRGPVRLFRYELVPGVRVSGSVEARGGTLRVTGRGATGTLRVGRTGRMTGVLDGVFVRYRPLAAIGA